MPDVPWTGWITTPRRWQAEALTELLDFTAEPRGRGGVVVAATGAGKSVLQAELLRLTLPGLGDRERVVVICPKLDLVDQLSSTFRDALGARAVATFDGRDKSVAAPVIVTTLHSGQRLARELAGVSLAAPLVLIDECHWSETRSVLAATQQLAPAHLIGFSATPYRAALDKDKLSLFHRTLYSYGLPEAIGDGVLVPPRLITLDEETAEAHSLHSVDDAVAHWITSGRVQTPALCNGATIADCRAFAARLQGEGVAAEAITGETPTDERQRLTAALAGGDLDVLVHCSLMAEGTDVPELRSIIMRRSVGSPVRWVQEIGRGLRSHPGKDFCLIFDPHCLSAEMALVHDPQLWEPLCGLVCLPRDDDEAAAVRTLADSLGFTDVDTLDAPDTDTLIDAVTDQRPDVVVAYCTDDIRDARDYEYAQPPRWRLVKKPTAVTHAHAIVLHGWPEERAPDPTTQRQRIEEWATRTGRDVLSWVDLHKDDNDWTILHELGIVCPTSAIMFGEASAERVGVALWDAERLSKHTLDALAGRDGYAERPTYSMRPRTLDRQAEVLSSLGAWLRQCADRLTTLGYARAMSTSRRWRKEDMTDKQRSFLLSLGERLGERGVELPDDARDRMRLAYVMARRGAMSKGEACDAITTFKAVVDIGEWVG